MHNIFKNVPFKNKYQKLHAQFDEVNKTEDEFIMTHCLESMNPARKSLLSQNHYYFHRNAYIQYTPS